MSPSAESPTFALTPAAAPIWVFISAEIDVRAFAWLSASEKIACQRRLAALAAELCCIAWSARFGAMFTIARRTASSFSA